MNSLPAKPAPSPFIVSPRADMMLIIGAVVLCPAILLPMAHFTSPYTVWLVVMTFGAVGHHLPSFLRTYGDRAIFDRFRIRLILAPIILFAVTLGFSLRGLHGMLLISMCWSIWHGMMQHFGFLRIYDSKVRSTSMLTARLDWWISASWFGMCLTFSPNQGGSLLAALYDSGVPLMPLAWIEGARKTFVILTAVVTLLYIYHAVRGNQPRSWLKLGLLVGTFLYVWVVRVLTNNPYLSVALFELLHDVQYLAIVWAFNRRLVEKGSAGVLPRFFYRPSAASVVGYVSACLAYGALGLMVYTKISSGPFKQVMEAFLITSGLLHFYYDSFIWKLRQPDTRSGLDLDVKSTAKYRPGWEGLGQPVLVGLMIILLARVELKGAASDELERAQAILTAVPDNPTSLSNVGTQLLRRDRAVEALPYLRKALALQPGMKEPRETLSDALSLLAQESMKAGRINEALTYYAEAVSIEPNSAERHNDFAWILAQAGRYDQAEASWRRALELNPNLALAKENLKRLTEMRAPR